MKMQKHTKVIHSSLVLQIPVPWIMSFRALLSFVPGSVLTHIPSRWRLLVLNASQRC